VTSFTIPNPFSSRSPVISASYGFCFMWIILNVLSHRVNVALVSVCDLWQGNTISMYVLTGELWRGSECQQTAWSYCYVLHAWPISLD
jgi:hypothetical protein